LNELSAILPPEQTRSGQIEKIIVRLNEMGIFVLRKEGGQRHYADALRMTAAFVGVQVWNEEKFGMPAALVGSETSLNEEELARRFYDATKRLLVVVERGLAEAVKQGDELHGLLAELRAVRAEPVEANG
jgi:hypothetical protein